MGGSGERAGSKNEQTGDPRTPSADALFGLIDKPDPAKRPALKRGQKKQKNTEQFNHQDEPGDKQGGDTQEGHVNGRGRWLKAPQSRVARSELHGAGMKVTSS